MYKEFDFTSRDDVAILDGEINILAHIRRFGINVLKLENCFDIYAERDAKVVLMAIDLKLNLLHLFSTMREMNRNMHRDDTESMFAFHGNWVCFIALYRSFFDKFMNVVVYTCYRDKYKDFDSARSKNKSFKKIILESSVIYSPSGVFMHFPQGFAEWAHDYLNKVNSQYRTAEIHGDGAARKWAFNEQDLSKTPIGLIQEFLDHMGQFIHIACFILVGQDFGKELVSGVYVEKS
jgi:hypothetical protein